MQYKVPMRDIEFVTNELLDFPAHYEKISRGANADPELVSAILTEAGKFAEEVIAPLNQSGDAQGCRFVDGKVITPDGFKEAFNQYTDNGWSSLAFPEAYGGQELPASLSQLTFEMFCSANHAWTMCPGLSIGAVDTILAHGSDELKNLFLPNMVAGKWTGTMCLTESHCGSDLGLLRTKAQPLADGSYAINGSKIFISSGDHDMAENIVHIVLARLPDAPAGVGGISLFVVPKHNANEDGSVGEFNHVSTGSIEEKMGIHGNPTCVLNFDGARGFLIGEPNKGMACMFTFINESRLGVAQSSQCHIEVSFQKATAYAQDRLQMRAPKRVAPEKAADPIISHPDVRRMLMTQKALTEGGRMLTYFCAQQVDLAHDDNDPAMKKRADTLLSVLTPIAKGFISEMSIEATNLGIQILGGHGFIKEWGLEQEYRDTRITALYEGTTGIQGLDLLGRKILASQGKVLQPLMEDIQAFCRQHSAHPMVAEVAKHAAKMGELTQLIGEKAKSDLNEVNAAAVDYLMYGGFTIYAYFWAQAAIKAEAKIAAGTDDNFYKNKIATAKFYFSKLLPRTLTLEQTIRNGGEDLMSIPADEMSLFF